VKIRYPTGIRTPTPRERVSLEFRSGEWVPIEHRTGEWGPIEHRTWQRLPIEHRSGEWVVIEHRTGEWRPIEHRTWQRLPIEHRSGEWVPVEHRTGEWVPIEHRTGEWIPIEHRTGEWVPTERRAGEWVTYRMQGSRASTYRIQVWREITYIYINIFVASYEYFWSVYIENCTGISNEETKLHGREAVIKRRGGSVPKKMLRQDGDLARHVETEEPPLTASCRPICWPLRVPPSHLCDCLSLRYLNPCGRLCTFSTAPCSLPVFMSCRNIEFLQCLTRVFVWETDLRVRRSWRQHYSEGLVAIDRLRGPVVQFVATDPEVHVRFPALPHFLRSTASGTGCGVCVCVCVCVCMYSIVVKALCYKPEGRGFETRWSKWFFL
jgi:hypothetical protein